LLASVRERASAANFATIRSSAGSGSLLTRCVGAGRKVTARAAEIPATAMLSDKAAATAKNHWFFQGMRFMNGSYPTPAYTQIFCPLLRSVYFKNSIC